LVQTFTKLGGSESLNVTGNDFVWLITCFPIIVHVISKM